MFSGKLVFSQVIDHLPLHTFRQCVKRYRGNHKVKEFTCLDQFLCMAFAQLTYRESLRDIEACLRAQGHKLYHMGIRSQVGVCQTNCVSATSVGQVQRHPVFAEHHLERLQRRLPVVDHLPVA